MIDKATGQLYLTKMHLDGAIPLLIFALTYLVLAIGKLPFLSLDRTGAALVGAIAMVVSGAIGERQARDAIDFATLGLLLGMMIIVASLRISGAFNLAAHFMLVRAKSGFALLAMTVAAAGIMAAFFINDVVCLALAPVLIEAAEESEISPTPLLLALATASNVGSAATITGNPQNMIVAGFAHLGYGAFFMRLAPASIIGLGFVYGIIAWVYRADLRGARFNGKIARPAAPGPIVRTAMLKSTIVALIALVLFAAGFDTCLVALSAGAVLLLTRKVDPERIYREIDWTMLVMFAGLFVVVAGAQTIGFQQSLIEMAGLARLANTTILAVTAAVLSNLVSNVPAVLLFKPLYPLLGGTQRVALVLASASTFAGNLTVVGSIANLIVIEQAQRKGIRIGYRDYLAVGVPITLLTLTADITLLNFIFG